MSSGLLTCVEEGIICQGHPIDCVEADSFRIANSFKMTDPQHEVLNCVLCWVHICMFKITTVKLVQFPVECLITILHSSHFIYHITPTTAYCIIRKSVAGLSLSNDQTLIIKYVFLLPVICFGWGHFGYVYCRQNGSNDFCTGVTVWTLRPGALSLWMKFFIAEKRFFSTWLKPVSIWARY